MRQRLRAGYVRAEGRSRPRPIPARPLRREVRPTLLVLRRVPRPLRLRRLRRRRMLSRWVARHRLGHRETHRDREGSTRRQRNWRARKGRRRARKQRFGLATSREAHCWAGLTNTPQRGRHRPAANRPRSAAAEPNYRAEPVKRPLPGPAREIAGVRSKETHLLRLWKPGWEVSIDIQERRSWTCSMGSWRGFQAPWIGPGAALRFCLPSRLGARIF